MKAQRDCGALDSLSLWYARKPGSIFLTAPHMPCRIPSFAISQGIPISSWWKSNTSQAVSWPSPLFDSTEKYTSTNSLDTEKLRNQKELGLWRGSKCFLWSQIRIIETTRAAIEFLNGSNYVLLLRTVVQTNMGLKWSLTYVEVRLLVDHFPFTIVLNLREEVFYFLAKYSETIICQTNKPLLISRFSSNQLI